MRNLCVFLAVLLLAACSNKGEGQDSPVPAVADTDSDNGKVISVPESRESEEPIDSGLAMAAKSLAAGLGEFRKVLPPNPLNCLALLQLKAKAAKLKYSAADSDAAKQYLEDGPESEQSAFDCDGLNAESPESILAWLEALPKAISYYQYVAEGAQKGFFRSVQEEEAAKPELNREIAYKFYLRSEIIRKDQTFMTNYFYFLLCKKFLQFSADLQAAGVNEIKVKSALLQIERALKEKPDSGVIKDLLAQLTAALWELSQSL